MPLVLACSSLHPVRSLHFRQLASIASGGSFLAPPTLICKQPKMARPSFLSPRPRLNCALSFCRSLSCFASLRPRNPYQAFRLVSGSFGLGTLRRFAHSATRSLRSAQGARVPRQGLDLRSELICADTLGSCGPCGLGPSLSAKNGAKKRLPFLRLGWQGAFFVVPPKNSAPCRAKASAAGPPPDSTATRSTAYRSGCLALGIVLRCAATIPSGAASHSLPTIDRKGVEF